MVKIRSVEDAEEVIKEKIPRVFKTVRKLRPVEIAVATPSAYKLLATSSGFYTERVRGLFRYRLIILKKNAFASVVLHEYGHYLDVSLLDEKLSLTREWSEIYQRCRSNQRVPGSGPSRPFSFLKWNRISIVFGSYYLQPREFFAECFSRYYFSESSKKYLEYYFPEAHEYFSRLEKDAEELVKDSLMRRALRWFLAR